MFEKFCMGLLFWVSFGACAQQILCLKSADEGVGRLQVRLPPVDRKTGDVLLEKNGETFVIYRKREAVEEKGPPATVVQFFLISFTMMGIGTTESTKSTCFLKRKTQLGLQKR